MGLFGNYNRVVVMGNITRDIELRTIPNGTRVTDIGIAINDRIKRGDNWEDKTTFVDVTLWGKTAELVERFGKKGASLLVEGRLEMDEWEDKATKQKRTKLKIVGDAITFMKSESRASEDDQGSTETSSKYASDIKSEGVPF